MQHSIDNDYTGYPVPEPKITLRDYQEAAVSSVWDYMRKTQPGKNPLVVLPTGAGKAFCVAALCHQAWGFQTGTRILVLTHTKELVQQDHDSLQTYWPGAPCGLFSAGLGRKDFKAPILFGGVQSVAKSIEKIGYCDLVIVDEAHLIPKSGSGQYLSVFKTLQAMNPRLRMIGLTATPFRTDSGYLHQGDGALFDDITYDLPITELIERGSLCRVTSKGGGRANIDTKGVKKTAGEFNGKQLQERAMDGENVKLAVQEMVARGQDRKGWMVFASGVEHANSIVEELRDQGVSTQMVVGDTATAARDRIIEQFKRQEFRCIVNVGVLTTGFNATHVDLIALLRPTQSPGLYIQMVGRGLRTHEGKSDCLILDFGENIMRHGPLDAIKVKEPGEGDGVAPMKECPNCQEMVAAGALTCPACGAEFPPREEVRHEARASSLDVISIEERPSVEVLTVERVRLRVHRKAGKPDSVKISYGIDLGREINEWVTLGTPWMRRQAEKIWASFGGKRPMPEDAAGWVERQGELSMPFGIAVNNSGRWPRVVERHFREPGDEVARLTAEPDPNTPIDIDLDDLPF